MHIAHRDIIGSTLVEFTHAWYQRDDIPPTMDEAIGWKNHVAKAHPELTDFVLEIKDDDKYNTLKDYRYCLAFDNGTYPNYFATQLTDTLLSWTLPVYNVAPGVSNTHEFFPEGSYIPFDARNHNDLIEMNNWVDLPRGAKVTGSRFYFLQGDLARLEMALQNYSANFLMERGYTLVQPPLMMNREAYEGVTDLGDFETVMYGVEPDKYYLIATSEHPLTAMRMDEIIEPAELPIKLVGVSSCFRREVGAHGLSDRGIWRVHQFTKIEMFAFTLPEASDETLDRFCELECELFDQLQLPYRVVDTATGDLGGPAFRKFDLEAWMPGRGPNGEYGEVTSASTCTDYQARGLTIRFKVKGEKGTQFVHTLN